MTALTTSDPQIIFANAAGAIVVDTAVECPICHSMHYFLQNINGRTTCFDCADPEAQHE